jgi:hypothetical protein
MVFKKVGIPLSEKKTMGPCVVLEYLGIILDTEKMKARIPVEKINRFFEELKAKCSCTKKKLLSVLGHFNFAARIIPAGRTFISYLLTLAHSVPELHYHVNLIKECRLDLAMWETFLKQWNGRSFFIDENITHVSDLSLYTDASSKHGFGGYFHGKWFQGRWPDDIQTLGNDSLSIALLELYPIMVTAVIWDQEWTGKRIKFCCDNLATVQIINKHRSKSPMIMKLLRKLTWKSACDNFINFSSCSRKEKHYSRFSVSFPVDQIPEGYPTSRKGPRGDSCTSRTCIILEEEAEKLCENSLNDNTKTIYSHGYNVFCQFLSYIGIAATDYKPILISEQTLILFVTHCNKALGLGHSTIKSYLAAVRFYYVKAGIHNPLSSSTIDGCSKLHMVLRGIKKQNHQKEKRRPITYNVLLQMQNVLQRGLFGEFLDSMFKAAFSLAFFAFLRCGEFTV